MRLLLCVRVLLLLWFEFGGLGQGDCCEYGMCRWVSCDVCYGIKEWNEEEVNSGKEKQGWGVCFGAVIIEGEVG